MGFPSVVAPKISSQLSFTHFETQPFDGCLCGANETCGMLIPELVRSSILNKGEHPSS